MTVITAKPIVFLGADRPGAKATAGYDVSVIDLSLKADGTATGTAAPAAKVKIGDIGSFRVEDYGSGRSGSATSRKFRRPTGPGARECSRA